MHAHCKSFGKLIKFFKSPIISLLRDKTANIPAYVHVKSLYI